MPANLFQAPTNSADVEARRHRIGTPWAPRTLSDIKEALGRNQPVAFGLRLYNSFFQADLNGGVVPMPDQATPSKKHAGLLVGFDDDSQRLVMRNSWGLHTASGRPCGDGGHYYLPYAYVGGELSMDFWAIPSLSG
ncbi:MAG: C1 family peptidase [Sphingobium sp.]